MEGLGSSNDISPEVEARQHETNIRRLQEDYARQVEPKDVEEMYEHNRAPLQNVPIRQFVPILVMKKTIEELESRLGNKPKVQERT